MFILAGIVGLLIGIPLGVLSRKQVKRRMSDPGVYNVVIKVDTTDAKKKLAELVEFQRLERNWWI